MTVFSRRTIGPKPRRTRAQMIAVVLVGLVVVLLIAEVISDAVNDSPQVGMRALATWAAGVEPLLSSSSAMGQAVQTIDGANASMTRARLDATLATLTSVTTANQTANDDLGIQAPSSRDSALVERVLSSRVVAATNFERSVELATTPSATAGSAASSCVIAGAAIKAGDDAIGALNGVFRTIHGVEHQQFRKWSTYAATLGSAGCSGLVHTLRANQALVLRSGLKLVAISVLPSPVQINGVPNPTTTTTTTSTTLPLHATTTTSTTQPFGAGTTTSTSSTTTTTTIASTTTTLQIPPNSARSVLPPTSSVTADVVVADSGDAPVRGVTVTVEVVDSTGREIAGSSNQVSLIGADSSAYLTIGPVHLGKITGTFELKVAASATGVTSAKQVITLVRSS
jgi:hypothetical protein